jgi:tRNA isopentenyl-2-thiomethyl-A-37 hydroxylase MiaE
MAVYVDALRRTSRTRAWPFVTAAHMMADTVEELHEFAARIGLKREWFQPRSSPHYDLTASRHAQALALGARLVDRHELVALIQRLRAG